MRCVSSKPKVRLLVSLFDLENREAMFPAVHRSYKFCLLTLGQAEQAEFVFFCHPR